MSIDTMLRSWVVRRLPPRVAIGAGLLTGGAVLALAHLAGADLRALTGHQAGLLARLVAGESEAGEHVATPPAQP